MTAAPRIAPVPAPSTAEQLRIALRRAHRERTQDAFDRFLAELFGAMVLVARGPGGERERRIELLPEDADLNLVALATEDGLHLALFTDVDALVSPGSPVAEFDPAAYAGRGLRMLELAASAGLGVAVNVGARQHVVVAAETVAQIVGAVEY